MNRCMLVTVKKDKNRCQRSYFELYANRGKKKRFLTGSSVAVMISQVNV